MATYVLGMLLLLALFFACRHMYRNYVNGTSDCLGADGGSCGSCGGSCAGCHPKK